MLCVFALASVFVTYFYLFLLCYFSLHFASSLPFFFFAAHIKSDTDLENVFIEGKLYPYIIKTQERRKKIEKHSYTREEW